VSDEFSWADLDESDIVTRGVKPTAVYLNPNGDIVIRQEAGDYQAQDQIIVLPVPYAAKLLALLHVAIAAGKDLRD
jgi:hypothetical protein